MRNRQDEYGRKQPQQRHDSEDDDDGVDDNSDDDQQQEHQLRCFGGSNSLLLLLSVLLTLVAVGSGFFFANIFCTGNILRSSASILPIGTIDTTKISKSNSIKNNDENLSITTTICC
jgi:hypothetical protein